MDFYDVFEITVKVVGALTLIAGIIAGIVTVALFILRTAL